MSSLIRHTPDRGQAEVNRCWSKVPLLQVDSVWKDKGAIESKSWFRTIPVDELIYSVIVVRRPRFEVRLFSTADFVCSRSGRARDRFRGLLFLRRLGILGGLMCRREPECSQIYPWPLHATHPNPRRGITVLLARLSQPNPLS
jgi:hypothetical protein